jgi:aspartyl-tRNA(Asn)/glutamyl-tRNA(Gln) amidotransferase subunit A
MPSVPDADTLAFTPIHALAPRIASGELAPRTLVAACLERIARADPTLHAFVAVYGPQALQAAEACGAAIAAGHGLGPLHGIPIAIKDLCDMEGRIATAGSRFWADRVSTATATVVRRLLAAGMVVLGKTHMVEFALGAWGSNAAMGAPWNPWDLAVQRTPGGSSSGSGVAVAAGLAPAALGSDTGGSVRIPSALCGLVGLKVTAGRISNHGVVPLSQTLDTIGPMTRSVEDAALLFAALNGPDPLDPATQAVPHGNPLPTLKRGVAGLRLGMVALEELQGTTDAVAAHYREAGEALAALGARVEPVRLQGLGFMDLQRQTGTLIGAEGYHVHRAWIERSDAPFDPHVQRRLLAGKGVSAADYIEVLRHRARASAEMGAFLADYDALLTPTLPLTAIPLAEVDEDAPPAASRFTRAVNYLGLCALALPMGFDAQGLPSSLQIIGKPLAEHTILRIGWAFEQARPLLAQRRPELSALLGAKGRAG